MEKIISKVRKMVIIDNYSRKITLTDELLNIDFDFEKDNEVSVSVVHENGKKRIVIEKI